VVARALQLVLTPLLVLANAASLNYPELSVNRATCEASLKRPGGLDEVTIGRLPGKAKQGYPGIIRGPEK
jgi:hypothetical protein